jgi:hypothetical protein
MFPLCAGWGPHMSKRRSAYPKTERLPVVLAQAGDGRQILLDSSGKAVWQRRPGSKPGFVKAFDFFTIEKAMRLSADQLDIVLRDWGIDLPAHREV